MSEINALGLKLGITSPRIVRKALELSQLLDVRAGSASLTALKLTGCCKSVMCLDLAAAKSSQQIDMTQAVRLSGMNKKLYGNSLKALESMLDLQEEVTIKDLTVQFGCTAATKLAEECLQSYKSEYTGRGCVDTDLSSTLFQAAAVCAACRKLKVKIERGKLHAMCSVKKNCFDKLVLDLEKYADNIIGDKKVVNPKRKRTFLDEVEDKLQEMPAAKQEKSDSEDKDIDFEEWKRKILANVTENAS